MSFVQLWCEREIVMNDDNQHYYCILTTAPCSTHSSSLLQEQPSPGWVEYKQGAQEISKESTFQGSVVIVAIVRWRMSTVSMSTSLAITMKGVLLLKLSALYAIKSTAISTAWGHTCTCRNIQIRTAATTLSEHILTLKVFHFVHWHSDLNLFFPAQRSIVSVGPKEKRSEARL